VQDLNRKFPEHYNTLLSTDSYKISHWRAYPPGMQYMHSYFESRGGVYPSTVFFGLQYYLQTALQPIWLDDLDEAELFCRDHFGRADMFNRAGWEHIIKQHDGRLPLVIRAVPEGMHVPTRCALFTVENTDPAVPWLTNYVETRLAQMWYPITVATLSNSCRKIILRYLERTGDPALIDFKLHDFGFRGSTSIESSAIGGLAHLVNFKGTDTISAILLGRQHYNCPMAGFSIPAAEHSTITSWGRYNEVDAFRAMLDAFPEEKVAVVSDSYDIYSACEHLWGEILHDQVLARNGTLVIRPDSGDPPTVVHKCLDILGAKFGFKMNAQRYRVLDPHVRLIQGDGVDPMTIDKVLAVLEINGWSADNVAFGMGGALLQKVNRDTCQFAFKCSSVVVNGVERDVYKDPVGDHSKESKRGRLSTFQLPSGEIKSGPPNLDAPDLMREVFRNGVLLVDESLDTIRERATERKEA